MSRKGLSGLFYQLMERYRRFMAGRYGMDLLGLCLLGTYLIANIVTGLGLRLLVRMGVAATWWMQALQLLPLAILGWMAWRALSRNIPARCGENGKFTEFWSRGKAFLMGNKQAVSNWRAGQKARKTHKIFRCPSCGQQARVPRGKGKIAITCPGCGREYVKKT